MVAFFHAIPKVHSHALCEEDLSVDLLCFEHRLHSGALRASLKVLAGQGVQFVLLPFHPGLQAHITCGMNSSGVTSHELSDKS